MPKFTSVEEVEIVRSRLELFDGNLNTQIYEQLTRVHERSTQHRLFWLMLDDETFEAYRHALEIFQRYGDEGYIRRAMKKAEEKEPIQYSAVISEIIAVAYYIEKFDYEKGKVTWERKVSESGRSVDVTIAHEGQLVNIEITGINESEAIRKFWELLHQIQEQINDKIIDNDNPRFSYFLTLPNDEFLELKDLSHLQSIKDTMIDDIASFIIGCKTEGVGQYMYRSGGDDVLSIQIDELNKSETEYTANLIGWSGEMTDTRRIRNKVVEKATYQLPDDEINFVYLPNLSMLSKRDYEIAMYGDIVARIYPGMPDKTQWSYSDTGITKIVDELKLSPVSGIIMGKLDYFNSDKRRVIPSNRTVPSQSIIDLVK